MPRRPASRRAAIPALVLAATTALAGCSASGAHGNDDGTLTALASFYPLQFVVDRVGGEHVDVSNLTPPAAEPHDLELSPAQVRAIGDADLVVYLSGFQPAVDEGIAQREPAHVVDAASVAKLEAHPNGGAASASDDDPADDDDGHNHGALDPHFWLDPSRLPALADAVAAELSAVDPVHADDYAANAARLTTDLTTLDTEMADALAPCAGATLVTSHEAFGYLAQRYGLVQVGIAGIDPDAEPSPARLRKVGDVVRADGVTTLFFESLANPKVTRTLADDLAVGTAALDPLERLSDESTDYLGVMRANLGALTGGLACS